MIEKKLEPIIPGVVYIYGEPYPHLRGFGADAEQIKEIERLKKMEIRNSNEEDEDMSLGSELRLNKAV